MTPRLIPVLLLSEGGLVKTVKFSNAKYVGDPINVVRILNEKEVDELVFLDITAGAEKREPDYALIKDIATECFMPFSYGGGVRNLSQIQKIITLGAEKVVLNSILFDDAKLVEEACRQYGRQSIVASVDVKKGLLGGYKVYRDSGKVATEHSVLDWIRRVEDMGVGEIMLTSINHEGTGTGYDLALYEMLRGKVSVPIVAHGGAGKMDDFRSVIRTGGCSAVAAGSFFVYHGKHRAVLVTYPKHDEVKSLFS